MNRLILALFALLISGAAGAQVYSPVSVTGFNLDGIADGDNAAATTTGTLDGVYVLYSASYGQLYGTGLGLPDDGRIVNGTHSFQMQPYKFNNTLLLNGGDSGTLVLSTPASFAVLSVLAISTNGNNTNNYTVIFTDGSFTTFSNVAIHDWFNGTADTIMVGTDRAQQGNGQPDNNTNNPRLYANDLPLQCADQNKLVKAIGIVNTGSGPTTCVFALSGDPVASYGFANTNPTCPSGSNGRGVVVPIGGLPPYSYTWITSPVQHTDTATGLAVGIYTVSVNDSIGCPQTVSDTVSQAVGIASILASADTICAGSGTSVTLTASGGDTYAWSTLTSDSVISVSPAASAFYTVTATQSDGCTDTASQAVIVNACTTGIAGLSNAGWNIYPNPGNGNFELTVGTGAEQMTITINDLQGRIIYTEITTDVHAGDIRQINIAHVTTGIYLMRVNAGDQHWLQKIAIQK